MDVYDDVKRKTNATFDWIINTFKGESTDKQDKIIDTINRYLASLNPPQEFRETDPKSILKDIEISFENACAALQESGIPNPKKLTVFEFEQRVDFFSKRNKSNNNQSF